MEELYNKALNICRLFIGAIPVADKVCRDGNVITGKGPGAAMTFALTLVEALAGKEVADSLRTSTVYD